MKISETIPLGHYIFLDKGFEHKITRKYLMRRVEGQKTSADGRALFPFIFIEVIHNDKDITGNKETVHWIDGNYSVEE